MSHHFDIEAARRDSTLNLNDFSLFAGRPGHVTMVMSVNPYEEEPPSDALNREGVYRFEFDLDGDFTADMAFAGRLCADGEGDRFEVRREVRLGSDEVGSKPLHGRIGGSNGRLTAFVGPRSDPFAADAGGLGTFLHAYAEGVFAPSAFSSHHNYFENRNVMAIALEVPTVLVGTGADHRSRGTGPIQPEPSGCRGRSREVLHSTHGNPADPHCWLGRLARILCGHPRRASLPHGAPLRPRNARRVHLHRFQRTGTRRRRDGRDADLLTNTPLGDGVRPDPDALGADFPYLAPPVKHSDSVQGQLR